MWMASNRSWKELRVQTSPIAAWGEDHTPGARERSADADHEPIQHSLNTGFYTMMCREGTMVSPLTISQSNLLNEQRRRHSHETTWTHHHSHRVLVSPHGRNGL